MFPKTGSAVVIAPLGAESGPTHEAREFYLGLRERFDQILPACCPRLQQVFYEWLLPQGIFTVLTLSGFGIENPKEEPVHWDISFETKGDKWLGITIPFVGEAAMEAEVDT